MKKKIKIKINGKFSTVNENLSLLIFLKQLEIPLKKVAIELNQEIIDKKKLNSDGRRKLHPSWDYTVEGVASISATYDAVQQNVDVSRDW